MTMSQEVVATFVPGQEGIPPGQAEKAEPGAVFTTLHFPEEGPGPGANVIRVTAPPEFGPEFGDALDEVEDFLR